MAPVRDVLADEAVAGNELPEVLGSVALSFERQVLAAVRKVFTTAPDPSESKDLHYACVSYLAARQVLEGGGAADDEDA